MRSGFRFSWVQDICLKTDHLETTAKGDPMASFDLADYGELHPYRESDWNRFRKQVQYQTA